MTSESDNPTRRAACLVEGRVQGVWFRKSAQKVAAELALSGWARNLDDGRVQVVVEGPERDLVRFIRWVWVGPALARVDHVDVDLGEPTGAEPVFEVRPNATADEAVRT